MFIYQVSSSSFDSSVSHLFDAILKNFLFYLTGSGSNYRVDPVFFVSFSLNIWSRLSRPSEISGEPWRSHRTWPPWKYRQTGDGGCNSGDGNGGGFLETFGAKKHTRL